MANAIETGSATACMNRRIGTLRHQRHRQQHDEHKDRDGDVERGEQLKEIDQDAHAQLADRVGDRRAHADWRHQHHDPREAEHRLGEALGKCEHRTPFVVRHHRERRRRRAR